MPEDTLVTEAMAKAIGVDSEPVTYEIERGHIRRFAEAIGDSNPLFCDEAAARDTPRGGVIAPPTFLRACSPAEPPVDVRKASGLDRVLDGGSEWEYMQDIRPGDRISATAKLVEYKERAGRMGKMLICTTIATYRNQFGQVVATQRTSRILY